MIGGVIGSLGLVALPAQAVGLPLVISATVNYSQKTLTISGQNFGSSPHVTLDSLSFPAMSSTSTQIVADFPSGTPPSGFTPGTYFLTVTFKNQLPTVFAVDIGANGAAGATGAQGPAGPPGAAGSMGPAGPAGPAGGAGPMGPPGSQGVQGSVGPMGTQGAPGPRGAQGSQGPQGPQGATGATGAQGNGLPANVTCGMTTWNGTSVAIVVDPAVFYTPSGGTGAWTCTSQLPRYVANGDGTVTDNLTGLMWEMQTSACSGEVTCWYNTNNWSPDTTADGTLFTGFIAGLNGGDYYSPSAGQDVSAGAGSCFANHCDWRLPTITELQTIVESTASGCGSGSPCIDPVFGPTKPNVFWSSSSVAGSPFVAWGVDFDNGLVGKDSKDGYFYARAVRSGR
jgi:hypothetical protein